MAIGDVYIATRFRINTVCVRRGWIVYGNAVYRHVVTILWINRPGWRILDRNIFDLYGGAASKVNESRAQKARLNPAGEICRQHSRMQAAELCMHPAV